MRLQCQAMALILGEQAAKDPAAAAGPVTGSSSSSQDIAESTDKKKLGAPTRRSGEIRGLPHPRSRKPLKR